MTAFNTDWWTVELPAEWHAEVGERGVGFERKPALGWLQVTTAHKPTTVTDADLEAMSASGMAASEVPRRRVSYSAVTGLSADHTDEESFWREWWLRNGNMMVYASYNVPKEQKNDSEIAEVEQIVSSLVPSAKKRQFGMEAPRSRRLPHRGSGPHFRK